MNIRSFWRFCLEIGEILLAMSGVVVRRMTLARTIAFACSLGVYFACMRFVSVRLAVWYFIAATSLHYVALFGVFTSWSEPLRGWAESFRRRYGEECGFRRYEALMTMVFFHNGASAALASASSPGSLYGSVPAEICTALGAALFVVGLTVKIWATRVVGIDVYYYRDMFLRRAVGEFQVAGPYRFLQNPMYGVGHLHGYGAALIAGSDIGLALVAVNQACVWLFYWTVEKPFVQEVYAPSAIKK